MDALGSRIKRLRLQASLSKAALARRVGVSDVTISYWESGTIKQVGHERLLALAEALGCSLSDLLDGTPAPLAQVGVLYMKVQQPPPWLHQGETLTPLLGGLPLPHLTIDCYLVTPDNGESFDFLAEGDLAAVLPRREFGNDGLYVLERFGRLVIRYLSRTTNGDIDINDESQRLETVPSSALPFTLVGQIRARWHLDTFGMPG